MAAIFIGTREKTRTSMPQGTLAPEASASTIPPLALIYILQAYLCRGTFSIVY